MRNAFRSLTFRRRPRRALCPRPRRIHPKDSHEGGEHAMKKVIVSLASLVFSLVLCGTARAQAQRNAVAAVPRPTAGIPPRAPTLTVAARLTLPDREPLPPTPMVALPIMRKDLERRLPPTLWWQRDAHAGQGTSLQRIRWPAYHAQGLDTTAPRLRWHAIHCGQGTLPPTHTWICLSCARVWNHDCHERLW